MKILKILLACLCAFSMILGLAACGNDRNTDSTAAPGDSTTAPVVTTAPPVPRNFKAEAEAALKLYGGIELDLSSLSSEVSAAGLTLEEQIFLTYTVKFKVKNGTGMTALEGYFDALLIESELGDWLKFSEDEELTPTSLSQSASDFSQIEYYEQARYLNLFVRLYANGTDAEIILQFTEEDGGWPTLTFGLLYGEGMIPDFDSDRWENEQPDRPWVMYHPYGGIPIDYITKAEYENYIAKLKANGYAEVDPADGFDDAYKKVANGTKVVMNLRLSEFGQGSSYGAIFIEYFKSTGGTAAWPSVDIENLIPGFSLPIYTGAAAYEINEAEGTLSAYGTTQAALDAYRTQLISAGFVDMNGTLVKVDGQEKYELGIHRFVFDADTSSAKIYFYRGLYQKPLYEKLPAMLKYTITEGNFVNTVYVIGNDYVKSANGLHFDYFKFNANTKTWTKYSLPHIANAWELAGELVVGNIELETGMSVLFLPDISLGNVVETAGTYLELPCKSYLVTYDYNTSMTYHYKTMQIGGFEYIVQHVAHYKYVDGEGNVSEFDTVNYSLSDIATENVSFPVFRVPFDK